VFHQKIILLILLVAAVLLVRISGVSDHITFENFKRNRDILQGFVKDYYILSVLGYIIIYISTAFFLPGAIPLTVVGGLLFGAFLGTVYVCIGATVGATLAFFSARYLIGNWIQDRYRNQLRRFNGEIEKNGYYYLLTLRIIPVFPFFLVNLFAGLTNIPYRIFLWTLLITALPGTVIYAFAGQKMGVIESMRDMYSPEVLIAFLLLIIFSITLLIFRYIKRKKG
jgi:uncharacterized membrane protein YdjX (TVP38/TMEM64 family)